MLGREAVRGGVADVSEVVGGPSKVPEEGVDIVGGFSSQAFWWMGITHAQILMGWLFACFVFPENCTICITCTTIIIHIVGLS